MKRFMLITLAIGSLLATVPVALADTSCNFSSPSFMKIEGNLIVPDNSTCNLSNSGTVSGNVLVGVNAGLALEGKWTISGYLQASGCAYVAINPFGYGSTLVGRYILIENCTGNSPALGTTFPAGAAFGSFGPSSLIGGSFRCHSNAGPCILVHDHVGGSVSVTGNRSSLPSQINGNSIAKSLYCYNNAPAPTGLSNWIAGNPMNATEGQCLGF
ncbi:MAG TPA: hypothetical protein VGV15_17625 [Terriglobales bacterium]|nr:hypothetical protein [Terriglobales bacterium]